MKKKLTTPAGNPIRTLLQIADDGTIPGQKIIIDGSTLQSIDASNLIPGLIRYAFNEQPIEITSAKANPASEGATVVISGSGSFRLTPTSVPVTLTLTLIQGNVQALFSYTMIGSTPPPKKW